MAVRRRITNRKSIIEKILRDEYAGGPVLLEELRWKVLIAQYGPTFTEMTDAKMKSFARTVREHFPQLEIRKIPVEYAPVGMIARAGLYRIRLWQIIDRFLTSFNQHVLVNIGFPDHDKPWVDKPRRVTVGCFFFDYVVRKVPRQGALMDTAMAKIVLPKSHTMIVVQQYSSQELGRSDTVASVRWVIQYFNNRIDGGGAWSLEKMSPIDRLPFREKRS